MLDPHRIPPVRHYLLTLPSRAQRRWLGFGSLLGLLALLAVVTRPDARPAALALPGPRPTVTPSAVLPTSTTPAMTMPGMTSASPAGTPLALSMAQLMTAPVSAQQLGFNPDTLLTSFDSGRVTHLAGGQLRRDYTIVAEDKRIELAPGVFYDAWTYNGRIPGPTLRATEGDEVRVTFRNAGSMPHSIHFHGIHPADQDGLEAVAPGAERVYDFTAGPVGVQLYHCHIEPLDQHIDRGLYGVFIIDPRTPRAPAHELVMMMNAFDVDSDGENDIYAVNSAPFAYYFHPINIAAGERVRIYLANMTGLDPINSFHLHANLFWLFRTGTRPDPDEYTDTVMMSQGERHILEFTYTMPGEYMFHAHQAEFSAKGWMGCFRVLAAGRLASASSACSANRAPSVESSSP